MNLLARIVCAWLAAALALGMPKASAQLDVSGSQRFGDNPAIDVAAKRLAPYFLKNVPTVRDWAAIYPTVPSLPNGIAFAPPRDASAQSGLEAAVVEQLHGSSNGAIVLGGGDYAIPVRLYCTDVLRRARAPETYVLGPLRGTRALVLTALYANAARSSAPFEVVQPLSWAIQEGLKYDDLPPAQQAMFDALLPGRRAQIAQSFLELMRSRWTIAARGVGSVPPFDDALPQMGEMGRFIGEAETARHRLLASETSFSALRGELVPEIDTGSSGEATSWNVTAPNVFERLLARGALGTVGLLEIHVDGNERVVVPITSNIAYPMQCTDCQPLTMQPLKAAPQYVSSLLAS